MVLQSEIALDILDLRETAPAALWLLVVLCYGLRTDFRGELFEGSQYLLAWADEMQEIKTICHSGKKATMNARLDEHGNQVTEGAQIDIGHHYEALSRKEFRLEEVSPVAQRPAT